MFGLTACGAMAIPTMCTHGGVEAMNSWDPTSACNAAAIPTACTHGGVAAMNPWEPTGGLCITKLRPNDMFEMRARISRGPPMIPHVPGGACQRSAEGSVQISATRAPREGSPPRVYDTRLVAARLSASTKGDAHA